MLFRKSFLFFSMTAVLSAAAFAQQTTPFILTEFPLMPVSASEQVVIEWAGAVSDPAVMAAPESQRYPDSATIYFSTDPGGSELENYTDSVTVFVADSLNCKPVSGMPPKRRIVFRPGDQKNMGPGIYYFMAARVASVNGKDTLFYSNELKFAVETDAATTLTSPDIEEKVTNLTPVFSWEKNPGVPYYHIILSDEKIDADIENQSIEGLSVIWQAITANTQITYGAPDPSGTLTADPPPMSPGQTYSWVVLNNYGNHPAYTSKRVGLPRDFTITGDSLKSPISVLPLSGDTIDASALDARRVEFAWTNLDSGANTYKLYIYVSQDYDGIEARMIVWENEYTAGTFDSDTARVHVDLKNILTNNSYTWKVIAVDDKGAGKSGEIKGFVYKGIPTGTLQVRTRERIHSAGSVVEKEVAAVKIEVEVLEGSMEAPLLFYTDMHGNLSRERPAGTYRITAVKDGFESATKQVTIEDGVTQDIKIVLQRPDASVYGKVVDESGNPVDLASVHGVSDRGDTVFAQTDGLGNFIMNCYQADWNIWVSKTGYIGTTPRDTAVIYGQNSNFGELILKRNRYVISGAVQNSSGTPLIGANVKLLRNTVLIDQIPSTSQEGTFSFSVEPGTYTITAEKTGFVTYRKKIDVVGSEQMTISMPAGAALIKGNVIGQTWGTSGKVYAPITNASVVLIDTAVNPPESIQAVSDPVYGDFALSAPGQRRFIVEYEAAGFLSLQRESVLLTEPGKTQIISDTLIGLARVGGKVKISSSSQNLPDVTVAFTDIQNGKTVTSQSDGDGSFEISSLPDGIYKIGAGKEGFHADSVVMISEPGEMIRIDTVHIQNGRAVFENQDGTVVLRDLTVYVSPGEKTIKWHLVDGRDNPISASVKLQSPLRKNVRSDSQLDEMGPGSYFMSIDADEDSIIDLAAHHFQISEDNGATVFTDSVSMVLTHSSAESLSVEDGQVVLSLFSTGSQLEDVYLYYKDHTEQNFDSIPGDSLLPRDEGFVYLFAFRPAKNGSIMQYYFRAKKGDDIYGYEQETFRTYIKPDTATLSRIVVKPGAGEDTLLISSHSEVAFTLQGYYGSQYIPDETMDGSAVTWKVQSGTDCRLTALSGLQTVLETGAKASGIVHLTATIDTTKQRLEESVSSEIDIPIRITGQKLDSIAVRRVDSENTFISRAQSARAEFTVRGFDKNKNSVAISARWSVWPPNAGTVKNGVFVPDSRFAGRAQVIANVNNISGVYNQQSNSKANYSGLLVRYAIPVLKDSVTNGQGCKIVFPDSVIAPGQKGEVQIEIPSLSSRVERNTGEYNMIGEAYDIDEINGVRLNPGTDSITLALTIPEGYRKDARDGNGEFVIGRWNPDSLRWDIFAAARVSDDGSKVSVKTSHFSRYAVLHKVDELKGVLNIRPNPFSPYIRPSAEYGMQYGSEVPGGVCFELTPVAQVEPLTVKVDIYGITGAHILSSQLPNPEREKTYHIWWDGKTVNRDQVSMETVPGQTYNRLQLKGKEMCRNGRYFVVVTIEDGAGNEKQYMKPVVLFK